MTVCPDEVFPDDIQITNRNVFGKLLIINCIVELTLLCPYVFKRAKQSWFSYVVDSVVFTKRCLARDLYD